MSDSSQSTSQLTRRSAAQLLAALPFATARGTAANGAVTVGLLGSGNRGTFVAGLLQKHTQGRVVALCDLFDEKMQEAKKSIGLDSPKMFKDFREMLRSDVDAVIIATPVFLHAEHFEAAVKAGKHIYIEKPAAADVEGCKRIIRAADSADRKLNIAFGFQRRYGQLYQKARRAQESGAIGRVLMGRACFIKNGGPGTEEGAQPPRPKTDLEKAVDWDRWQDLSGDLIVENNVHSIDVLNWFLGGRPQSAIGSGGRTKNGMGDLRDHNFVAFEYPSGVQGQLTGTSLAPPGYRDVMEQFFGEKGVIETSENHWRHWMSRDKEISEKAPRNITIDAVEEFVKRIAEKRPENVGIRGAESTLTAILGRMAMEKRREVTWDEMMRS